MSTSKHLEKFLLRQKKQIVQSLNRLVKNKCLVTARFDSGKTSFITLVIDVLPDENMVVFDYGPDEAINSKMLSAGRVTFVGSYQGVRVQFSADQVSRANFKGDQVFAAPIPENLLWVERREFYRVKSLLTERIGCQITLENGEHTKLTVLDISISGLALEDSLSNAQLTADRGALLSACRLFLPGYTAVIDLEIRNQMLITLDEGSAGYKRIGCIYVNPNQLFQSKIHQYMQAVERQRKQLVN